MYGIDVISYPMQTSLYRKLDHIIEIMTKIEQGQGHYLVSLLSVEYSKLICVLLERVPVYD